MNSPKFFSFLVKNEDEKKEYLMTENVSFYDRKLLICKVDEDDYKKFACFRNYIEFFKYMESQTVKSFFEVILGNFKQKPHFDIDIKPIYINENLDLFCEKLLDKLITSCINVLSTKGINIIIERDILIYDSNGEDKRSYHLVINNYSHSNNYEAKEFYRLVVENMNDEKYSQFIDHMVYSTKQQFRTLYSSKIGSNRYKKFNREFKYNGKMYEHLYLEDVDEKSVKIIDFTESLVSWTGDCDFIPNFLKYDENKLVKFNYNFTNEEQEQCFKLLEKYYNPIPFNFVEVNNNMIILKNCGGYECIICNSIHDNQNPYMYTINGSVFFNCRRNKDNNSFELGLLEKKEEEVIIKKESKEVVRVKAKEEMKTSSSCYFKKEEKIIRYGMIERPSNVKYVKVSRFCV